MKPSLILVAILLHSAAAAECISDLDAYWDAQSPSKGGAYASPEVKDFHDLNDDGEVEKIVVAGGGKLGSGIIYLRDEKSCYHPIYEGTAEVAVKSEYTDPAQGADPLAEFNGFKFLTDRWVGGCAGGDRGVYVFAYSQGEYREVYRSRRSCLQRLTHE